MPADFHRRFNELCKQAEAIEAKKSSDYGDGWERISVDGRELLNWQTKVRHLLEMVCGKDSQHLSLFLESSETGMYTSSYDILVKQDAVLLAAKDDYEGGYLNKMRNLIQAEVFDTELEQATGLLVSGYLSPASVIAGVVLETGLRQMCIDNGVEIGKLDKMNADLAKAGIISKLVQKQLRQLPISVTAPRTASLSSSRRKTSRI